MASTPSLKVKKGDDVLVITGKEKGKKGKVIATYPRQRQVKVEGINIVKKHAKPTQKVQQGGIRELEAPMDISKVKVICPVCEKPTRLAKKEMEESRLRECKKCGEAVDK